MEIRPATTKDFAVLYQIGLDTPEFEVSDSGPFMERDEFLLAIENPKSTFLVAEIEKTITGFIYLSRQDIQRAPKKVYACLIYLVVRSEYRHQGIAQALYTAAVSEVKKYGIQHLYTWASTEGDGSIIQFLKKNHFTEGHIYRWMDNKI